MEGRTSVSTLLPPEAQRLLTFLHRGGTYGYYWIASEAKDKQGEPVEKVTKWYASSEPPPLPIDRNGHGPRHLYHGVHPVNAIPSERTGRDGKTYKPKPEKVRPKTEEIAAINCLFGEFDDYAPPREIKPTVRIASSHGKTHEYWGLREPFILDMVEKREYARQLQAAWVRFVGSDDGAKDLARVLRTPGTVNYKEAYGPDYPLVTVLEADYDRLYSLDELAALCANFLTPEPLKKRPTVKIRTEQNTTVSASKSEREYAEAYLGRLNTSRADDYHTWLAVGMALTPLGLHGLALWEDWSRNSAKYKQGECEHKWSTFSLDSDGVGKLGGWANEDDPNGKAQPKTPPTEQTLVFDDKGFACCPDCDSLILRSKFPYPGTDVPGWYCPHCKHSMIWPLDAYTPKSNDAEATPDPKTPLTRDFIFKCLKEDEAGDAQMLEQLYTGQLVYDHAAAHWYSFEKHAWQMITGTPRRRVWSRVASVYLSLAAELQAEIEKISEVEKQAPLLIWIDALTERTKKLRRLNRCNSVLTLAQELIGINGDEWDRDPWLLAVPNGVVDLRTGQLRNGKPDDYIRTVAPTVWEGIDTPCPRWERFVSEVMSNEQDRVAFLQRLMGYSLNGTTREHVLAMLVGHKGRNGKRVLIETVQAVLGNHSATVSTDVVIGQEYKRIAGSAQPHLMELMGKRLVTCSETEEGAQLSTAQVKNITGGDKITARWLHENPVSFAPSHTLFLQTNRKPQAPADDDALWERVKVIEFKVRFVDEPNASDERPRDPELEPALLAETSGILAWLVRGHLEYLKNGLQTPQSVKLARDDYRKGESIEPFLEACCDESEHMQADGSSLYEAYKHWCQRGGMREKTPHWFGKQLVKKYERGRTSTGRICYYGVGLTVDEEDTPSGTEKGSDGFTKPNTPISEDDNIPFTEPFSPFSKSSLEKETHEDENMTKGSKGSEGSATDTEAKKARTAGTSTNRLDLAAAERARRAMDAMRWPVALSEIAAIRQRSLREQLERECIQRQSEPVTAQ